MKKKHITVFMLLMLWCMLMIPANTPASESTGRSRNIVLMNVSGTVSYSCFIGQKQAFIRLLAGLRETDEIALITYGDMSTLVLNGTESRNTAIARVCGLRQSSENDPDAFLEAMNLAGVMLETAKKDGFEGTIIQVSSDTPADYHLNLLKEEHGAKGKLSKNGDVPEAREIVFGVHDWIRKNITAIYVLDTLEDMPESAVDISEEKNYSVMGWLDGQTLYIGGEGGVLAPNNGAALFAWFENAKVIDLGGCLHTDNTKNFKYMFYHNYALEYLNISGIDTSIVKDMTKMFVECRRLRSVDLSSFRTDVCTSFYAMFNKCESLTELDLSTFYTPEVVTCYMMFANCTRLSRISWDSRLFITGKVNSMAYMFSKCVSLTSVDPSAFSMGMATNLTCMFNQCVSLPYLDLSRWNVRPDANRKSMFSGSSLQGFYGENGEFL